MQQMPELNQKILHLGQQGHTRQVFLRKVSKELLIFTNCDELELRLANKTLQYIWLYNSSGKSRFKQCHFKMKSGGNLKPCFSNSSLPEKVCWELFQERYNPELKFRYQKQSILVSDSFHDKRYRSTGEKSLGKLIGYGSLFYLSFITDDDIPGLLILKKKEQNYFNHDDKTIYENLAQTMGIAIAFRRSQIALGERVKELTCLHSISKLLQESDLDMDATFQKLVQIIPGSFQYPEFTQCRIDIQERSYISGDHRNTGNLLTENIMLGKEKVGSITIELIQSDMEFLREEYDLLSSIAGAIGALYQKLQSEEYKKEISEKLRQADRLATIGQLAAGIAHELNEPLSNILGYAQLVAGDLSDSSRMSKDVEKIISSSLHAREIVRKLLLFAHQMPMKKVYLSINKVVRESLQIISSRLKKSNIELLTDLSPDLPDINADASQLKQVVINLLVNALQAMPGGGKLEINTYKKSGKLLLEVKDNGSGISAGLQKKIFLPFFTTKEPGEGTGLGLAVVHGIVKAHSGKIKINSSPGEGTKVVIKFPLNGTKI